MGVGKFEFWSAGGKKYCFEMAMEETRYPDHERVRMVNVILESPECQKLSKSLRSALQSSALICAGEEVTFAGDMQPPKKYEMFSSILEAHKTNGGSGLKGVWQSVA